MTETVDWDALPGAYGHFSLGDHMAALQAGTAEADDVWQVHAHVCHQDRLGPGAQPVVRALMPLTTGPLAEPVLMVLEAFAAAAWAVDSPLGFIVPRDAYAGRLPATTPAVLRERMAYRQRMLAVRRLLVAGGDALVRAAEQTLDEVALRYALRLLALGPDDDAALRATLQTYVASTRTEVTRAQARLAIAARFGPSDAPDLSGIDSDDPTTRACVATTVALHPEGPAALDDDTLAALLDLPCVPPQTLPWSQGIAPGLLMDALCRSTIDLERLIDLGVAALQRWAEHPEDPWTVPEGGSASQLGDRLFGRVFRAHWGRRDYLTADELSPRQQRVLDALTPAVQQSAELYAPAACGIRAFYLDRERLLGRDTGGLDRRVSGTFVGIATVTWPIWKWFHAARDYDAYAFGREASSGAMQQWVGELLRDHLAPAAIDDALADAATGAYGIDPEELRVVLRLGESAVPARDD